MLRIIAMAPDDGWAFVERDNGVVLIRPPYAQSSSVSSSREAAEKAVTKYAFGSSNKDFPSWSSLLEYLRSELLARKREAPPVAEFAPEILASAPKELKGKMLEQIGQELIPNQEWEAAVLLLKSLQRSQETMDDPDLRAAILEMLNRCADGMLRSDCQRRELLEEAEQDIATQFPLLEHPDAVSKLAREIAEKHQIFEVGAAA